PRAAGFSVILLHDALPIFYHFLMLLQDAQFGKFKQQLFLPQLFEENSCFDIRLTAFQVDDFTKSEALMLYFHPDLQIAGVGWCEARSRHVSFGQYGCRTNRLGLRLGKSILLLPCNALRREPFVCRRSASALEVYIQI